MANLEETCRLFNVLCGTKLSEEDILKSSSKSDMPKLSSEDCIKLVKMINDAKAEAERLHILEIMGLK